MTKQVCMFTSSPLFQKQTGGIKRFIELYGALIRAGYAVDLYSADDAETLRKNRIEGYSIRAEASGKGLLRVPSIQVASGNRVLYHRIKQKHYALVIAFDVPSAMGLCLFHVRNICLFFRQDLIAYRRTAYVDRGMPFLRRWILLTMCVAAEELCIRRARWMIVQGRCDADALKARHPLLHRRLESDLTIQINNINPSWVETNHPFITDLEKRQDIIFLGNFKDTRKGHDLLLDALELLKKRNITPRTVILGDGKMLESARHRYRDLENVVFTGHISNPAQMICESRLMVVPSRFDSCPNTVLEALYYGVPVIGADASGIPEILNDTDWLFGLSAGAIADKIEWLLKGDHLDKLLQAQQKRRKALTFDWGEVVVHKLEELSSRS